MSFFHCNDLAAAFAVVGVFVTASAGIELPVHAAATPPSYVPVEIFAKPAGFEKPSIAPDGLYIAYAERNGEQQYVSIAPVSGKSTKIQIALPKDHMLNWIRWAGSGRLVVSMNAPVNFFGEKAWTSFLTGVDIKTGKTVKLSRDGQGLIGDNVIFIDPDGAYLLVSVAPNAIGEPKVYKVNVATGDQTEVENNRPYIRTWLADRQGNVRLGLGYADKKDVTYYRSSEEQSMRRIANAYDVNGPEGGVLLEFDQGFGVGDDGAALVTRKDSFTALHKFSFETSVIGEPVYAKEKYDVTSFTRDRWDGTLESVRYTDRKHRTFWLKPEMQSIQTALEKSLPQQNVHITSRSRDNKTMIVETTSPTDPGSIYIYDALKPQLHRIGGVNDAIDPETMGTTRYEQYAARDGTVISSYLTLPRGREPKQLPLIILPHDAPLTSRDSWTFKNIAQLLANRGYAVLQPNYRGSSGYGAAFSQLATGQIGKAMQDDLDDGMDWLVSQNIVDPSRVCIAGTRYGGYAAIWGVMRNPERYRCAATFAPITGINTMLKRQPQWLNDRFSRGQRDMTRKIDHGKQSAYDPRFDLVSPTKSNIALSRPVLIAYRKKDLAQKEHFDEFKSAAGKQAPLIEELAFEDEDVLGLARYKNDRLWLESLEAFLAKHNPADPIPAG